MTDPKVLETVYRAVVARYEAGEDMQALHSLDQLAAIAPATSFYRQHYFYFKINILAFRLSDLAAALPLCEAATRAFPGYAEAWFLRGRVLAELGRAGPARKALSRALEIDPDNRSAIYELAKLQHQLGRRDEAGMLARRGLDLGLDEPLLHEIAQRIGGRAKRVSLATPWRAAPRNAVREAAASDAPDACRGVFMIVGSSYCGSTLLGSLLGAHPSIAGGGELHWLAHRSAAERAKDGRCVFCGDACRVWTPAVRDAIRPGNLYEATARAFGRPIVCDTSKMPDWSRFIAPATRAPRVRVLMVKHPLRHVASFVDKARRYGYDYMRPMADIDRVLRDLANLYVQIRREPVDVLLRYEDLVADPKTATTAVLARFGLDHHPAMDAWRAAEHHYIGGNGGPRSQIFPANRPHGGFLQRKYNRGDIFLDDSFATILSPEEIEQVVDHPLARAMFDAFGYAPRIDPTIEDSSWILDLAAGEASLRAAPQPLIAPFEACGGHRYRAYLELMAEHRFLASMAESRQTRRRSPLEVLEDGRPLGPAHVSDRAIAAHGEGRFRHFDDALYFSTSDNTDPNTNGRRYTIALR